MATKIGSNGVARCLQCGAKMTTRTPAGDFKCPDCGFVRDKKRRVLINPSQSITAIGSLFRGKAFVS